MNNINNEYYIRQTIRAVGDNPDRSGLEDTPLRVVKSWESLFSGYTVDIKKIFKVFDGTENYDQIVLLKDIEFYSTCEHHMLPFYGKAHVAYIPGESGQVIGISKLARLVDAYARRMQIQERIGQQVTAALEANLDCGGAACILSAKHLCMMARGVEKQNSEMVTSSLTGSFLENTALRAELYSLIGRV